MEGSRRLPVDIQQRAYKKLIMINNAATIEDLRIPPSNHLEKLSGSKEGQYIPELIQNAMFWATRFWPLFF